MILGGKNPLSHLLMSSLLVLISCSGRVPASRSTIHRPAPAQGSVGESNVVGRPSQNDSDFKSSVMNLSSQSLSCAQNPIFPRARIWRLSKSQIQNTIEDTLGVKINTAALASFNDISGVFFNSEEAVLNIKRSDYVSWRSSVKEIANQAASKNAQAFTSCQAGDKDCLQKAVIELGKKMFRRPLTEDEVSRYTNVAFEASKAKLSGTDIAKTLLSSFLLSPHFLFRTELGTKIPGQTGQTRLTAFEVASLLSYTLWQTSPDAKLLQAAESGALKTPQGLQAELERMTADPKAKKFFVEFLYDVTRSWKMSENDKITTLAQANQIMAGFKQEFDSFVEDFVAKSDNSFAQLFSHPRPPASDSIETFRNTSLADGGLSGILSLGAIHMAGATGPNPSPVKRGIMVREHFLCAPVPPPPEGIDTDVVHTGDAVIKTNRERYEVATASQPSCASCHRLFNSFGYAFEGFDHFGRYRKDDGGHALDLGGKVFGVRNTSMEFSDLSDLGHQLSQSKQASECMVLNAYRFVHGRTESRGDTCYVSMIHDKFEKNGKNLRLLAIDLLSSEAALYRSAE